MLLCTESIYRVPHNNLNLKFEFSLLQTINPLLAPQQGDRDVCVMYNTMTGIKNNLTYKVEYFMMWEKVHDFQFRSTLGGRVVAPSLKRRVRHVSRPHVFKKFLSCRLLVGLDAYLDLLGKSCAPAQVYVSTNGLLLRRHI